MNPGISWKRVWRRPDVLSAATLFCVALFAWIAARDLAFGTLRQPGPGFLPKNLAVLLAAFALLLLLRGLLTDAPSVRGLWPERAGLIRVVLMLAALLGYVAVLETAGFLLVTAGLFVIMLRWVGRRSWITTLVVALGSAVGSYLLFARWLMVSLPGGVWAP